MDEMLLLMIGEKDDTTRKWGCGRREEWHLRDSHSARCIAFRVEAVCGGTLGRGGWLLDEREWKG